MSEKRIYVFSLSREDEAFREATIETAVDWLRNKDERPYLFRKGKPARLPSGSIVLFSFQGQIFGQATVKREPKELSLEERKQAKGYKYSMILNGSSIEIFPEPYLLKKDAAPKIGKNFGRFFTILDSEQYHIILKMSKAY